MFKQRYLVISLVVFDNKVKSNLCPIALYLCHFILQARTTPGSTSQLDRYDTKFNPAMNPTMKPTMNQL